MTSVSVASRNWPRWWIGVVLVLALQLVLIFVLNKESEATPPKLGPQSLFRFLTANQTTQLLVIDPTLFALPHRDGFSGGTWQEISQPPFRPIEWLDDADSNLLTLSVSNLGTGLSELLADTEESSFPIITMAQPEAVFPPITPVKPISSASAFWIEGDLAKRKLLSGIAAADLRAFTHGDLLTNNRVQVLVDAHGNTLSAVLLRPRSGLDEADRLARQLAKSARFEPLENPTPEIANNATPVTLGLFIFRWQTLPPASTNLNTAPQ